MLKASFTLPNGIKVNVEGPAEEVRRLLDLYGGGEKPTRPSTSTRPRKTQRTEKPSGVIVDLAEIVNLAKTSEEAESIEGNILLRTSLVDRTLLPLYIVHEHKEDAFGLTSGEINKVLTDLGAPVSQPNVASTLSGTASRYVVGDRVRKRGVPVRYRLTRRGVQYMKEVLSGRRNGE